MGVVALSEAAPDFRWLVDEWPILVTGPHRSGTTIAARMIAADTGFELCLEERIKGDAPLLLQYLVAERIPRVIQCPFLSDIAHEFDATVVMMKRDTADIRRSRREHMYLQDGHQVRWYELEGKMLRRYAATHYRDIGELIYEVWELQKPFIRNWYELDYSSLRQHHLWRDQRDHFHVRQTDGGPLIEKKLPRPGPEPVVEIINGMARIT